MDAGVYYINGYPSAYVYDYARGGENSPSSCPASPPLAQLQTLKFHKQLLLFCHGLCYIGNFSSRASFPSL
jgi:hypothetical protein